MAQRKSFFSPDVLITKRDIFIEGLQNTRQSTNNSFNFRFLEHFTDSTYWLVVLEGRQDPFRYSCNQLELGLLFLCNSNIMSGQYNLRSPGQLFLFDIH